MIPAPFNIEAQLADYFKACYRDEAPGLPAEQYRDVRQSFYAGVACLYGWLQDWNNTHALSEEDLGGVYAAQVRMVNTQIQNYAKHCAGN
jgi:hypothetical protein